MRDINKLNDKNQIDLESLNNFLLEKGDNYLHLFLLENDYIKLDKIDENIFNEYIIFYLKDSDGSFMTYDKCKEKLSNDFDFPLWKIPHFLINYELSNIAVLSNVENIYRVPQHLKDYSLWEKVVSQNGNYITDVPKDIENYYNLCRLAIINKPRCFPFIEKNTKNYNNLCKLAVSKDGWNLDIVPLNLRTYEICYIACNSDTNYKFVLQSIPKNIENYYFLLKICYEKNKNSIKVLIEINEFVDWTFPKEYIPQLIKDFPEDKEYLENFLLKEYISKEVRKLLKENNELNNNNKLQEKSDVHNIDLESLNNFLLEKGDDYLDVLLQINDFKKIDYSNEKVLNIYIKNTVERYYDRYLDYTEDEENMYGFSLTSFVDYIKNNLNNIEEQLYNNYKFWLFLITKYNTIFFEITPKNLIDYPLCEKAVSENGRALQYVPEHLKDYSLCEKAILKSNITALEFVNKKIENYYSLLKLAFKSYYNRDNKNMYLDFRYMSKWIPKEYMSQLIKDVPEAKEDVERFLLQEYISKEVRKLLKENNELPDNKLQEKSDEHKLDLESLNNFFLKEGDNYLEALLFFKKYINVNYSNQYVKDYIIEKNLIYNLPPELYNDYDFWYKAVIYNSSNLHRVPVNLVDYPMCEMAIYQSGYALRYVPEHLRDYPLCEKAVSNYSGALADVPKNIDNYYNLIKIAFQNNKFIFHDLEDNEDEDVDIDKFIPQIIKDFPEDKEFLERYLRKEWLLKEYITKKVRKLLKETLFTKKKLL